MPAPVQDPSVPFDMPPKPNPIDVHVGRRIRMRRMVLGLSQEKLASSLGLTFQQVQKYERGANRVGASRLHQIAEILNVPVSFFFEEMTGGALAEKIEPTTGDDPAADFGEDVMRRRETLDLVRAYYRIPDKVQRKRVFDLVKSMAGRRA